METRKFGKAVPATYLVTCKCGYKMFRTQKRMSAGKEFSCIDCQALRKKEYNEKRKHEIIGRKRCATADKQGR